MEKIKIAFFDTKPYDRESFLAANRGFNYAFTWYETRLTAASAAMAAGHQVVCAFVNDELDEATIRKLAAHGVKLIAMRCAGFNNVDLAAACDAMDVVRVPAYSPYAVAEYTLGMLLCLDRKLHRAFCRVRENNFSINGLLGFDLRGKTIGIIGTGKIGQVFAQVIQGLGMRILAYDPYPNKEAAKHLHFEYSSLAEIYAACDVISLHCPLTPENRYMINKDSIAQMKDGVILINTSRGKLVDTKSLIDGLKSHKIGGAALDVYEEEAGYFFEDRSAAAIDDDMLARLLTFPNVLVTSHQAFFTREALDNIAHTTLENIRAFETGSTLQNSVCPRT